MKKTFLRIVLVIAVLFTAGIIWIQYMPAESDSANQTVKTNTDVAPSSETPTSFTEPVVRTETLPEGVYPEQVTKVLYDQYALVVAPSMHYALVEVREKTSTPFSGILQWDTQEGRWEKMIIIEDTESDSPIQNNPFNFSFEGPDGTDGIAHLSILDTRGAGSGEGTMKEFIADNLSFDSWTLTDCYYSDIDGKRDDPTYALSDSVCTNVRIGTAE